MRSDLFPRGIAVPTENMHYIGRNLENSRWEITDKSNMKKKYSTKRSYQKMLQDVVSISSHMRRHNYSQKDWTSRSKNVWNDTGNNIEDKHLEEIHLEVENYER